MVKIWLILFKLANVHKEDLLFVSNADTYANPVNANHVLKRICKNLEIYDVTSKPVSFGGGEESRTPVQNFFHTNISECSLLLKILLNLANKQTWFKISL